MAIERGLIRSWHFNLEEVVGDDQPSELDPREKKPSLPSLLLDHF